MKIDSVIVGCGIAGSILSRRLAEEKGQQVLVVERRSHVGGYCYDYRNEDGILVHRYGPHIFRTNSRKVWDYLSRFTKWHDYQHRVLTFVNGQFFPIPINLDTVNGYLGTSYTSENIETYIEGIRKKNGENRCVKDVIESQIGTEFYKAFFKNYTEKQWGMPCEELPPEIVARVPIRTNRDNRYFTHQYQALPEDGYTTMIQNILNHPNIHVMLNTDYEDIRSMRTGYTHLYYSGSIDEYYGYRFGKLPYRCVSFEFLKCPTEYYQPVSVVNYPNNYDYTRITEFKHFYGNKTGSTVIAKEFPSGVGDPSYPIPIRKNKEKYRHYQEIEDEGVTFIGRLGEYQYYSMDQIVEKILGMEL